MKCHKQQAKAIQEINNLIIKSLNNKIQIKNN